MDVFEDLPLRLLHLVEAWVVGGEGAGWSGSVAQGNVQSDVNGVVREDFESLEDEEVESAGHGDALHANHVDGCVHV